MTIKTMQQAAIAHLVFSTINAIPPGIATNSKKSNIKIKIKEI